jgi:homogentisate phytyltransferase/homogentisate geranylgeranyltransferase
MRLKQLKIFWSFSRPHTLIGSFVSVTALYIMGAEKLNFLEPLYILSLLSALLCNIFITGYNQLVDVELDKVNKPDLPLASGELGRPQAQFIVWASLGISLAAALYLGLVFFGLIATIAILGFIYSWKTFLKRHHQTAAMAIILVRGVLVNLGFYLHFSDTPVIPTELWMLVFFVSAFSLGIAWFKDIPDYKGDREVGIGSLAVRLSIQSAFTRGFYLIASSYTILAFLPLYIQTTHIPEAWISLGHGILGLSFILIGSRVKLHDPEAMPGFYRKFWILFFLEYLLFAAGWLAGT